VAYRPHDNEQRAQRNRGTQELHRLLSRTSISIIALGSRSRSYSRCSKRFTIRSPHLRTPYLGTKICRVSEEVTRLAEQSFLRTLERDRYRDMCIADLQEGIENYSHMFDKHLRLVDFVHQQL
jgi:hypothetical protein